MINPRDLKKLAMIDGPCLSVFEPLRDTYSQVTKADTRITSAAQQAEVMLAERGLDEGARERYLRPLHRIARTVKLTGRTGSVVVFRAPHFTRASFWPEQVDSRVVLSEEFFVLPLLAKLTGPQGFWLLALTTKDIRLFHGTVEGLTEAALPKSLPRSLAAAGGFDQPDHDLEGRSAPGASSGQTAAVRFGTSSAHEAKAGHIHDFFRLVDRAIHPLLARTGEPLVLAAVSRELAIYRSINTYEQLWDEGIHGSPDQLSEQRMHQTALELVAGASKTTEIHRAADLENAAGKGLLLQDLTEILGAARLGKVERLYLSEASRADQELKNAAAMAVIRNSGSVVWEEVPGVILGSAAAVLRYRSPEATRPATAAGKSSF